MKVTAVPVVEAESLKVTVSNAANPAVVTVNVLVPFPVTLAESVPVQMLLVDRV